jgi:hypothetical protein
MLTFNVKIASSKGRLFEVKVKRREIEEAFINVTEKKVSAVNVDNAHEVLGHISRPMTASIAKHLRWVVSGKPLKCE